MKCPGWSTAPLIKVKRHRMKVLLETARIQFMFPAQLFLSRVRANAHCHLEWSTSRNCFLVSISASTKANDRRMREMLYYLSVCRDAFILLLHPLAIEP